ncbi:MAG: ABC transporter ATP-binding protein [Ardenticatenaceae bacterium]|nr:ABC transporter ATP-binding protein [Ardenticatenaceae bacterium]MCB9445059.1 ABC transporter ATP-binding protein [Ardenticatenaceae bacterium]
MNGLRRTLPFVRPYRWTAFFMLLTTVLPAGMELVVPRALRTIIDQGITPGDMNAIVRGSVVMLVAALIGAAATLSQGYFRATMSQGLAYDMRNKLFAHIQTFSFANLDQMQTGQLMTRLSSDIDIVRMFSSAGISLLFRVLTMIIGSVVLMSLIDWQLTLVMAVLLPLAGLVIWNVIRLAQPLFTIVQEKLAALNTIVQENLAGAQVVKAFVRERYEIGRFRRFNDDFMAQNITVGRLMAVALPALTILTNLGIVAVLWFGGRDTINGRLTVGELVAFNNYLMIGMSPLMLLGNILTMVSRAEASAIRMWEVLDTEPIVKTAVSPHTAPVLHGAVTFNNVTFHYDGVEEWTQSDAEKTQRFAKEKTGSLMNPGVGARPCARPIRGDHKGTPLQPQKTSERQNSPRLNANGRFGGQNVLNGISFTAQPGQRIALLGATGSGKSSLVNLIPRFYDANQGQISIDGVDVRQWEPEALRKRIGVVLQQTTLFSGTVRENIAYGRPDASLDEVITAAQAAQAHDFIMALPDGYDSLVEERGANLSGGQKQRIAIARALLINPAILILDDSTSAVDMETEAKIKAALDAQLGHMTTFIVAQRINSVLNADQILVLEHGRIAAQGTHQELLASSPIYQEIYESQLGRD